MPTLIRCTSTVLTVLVLLGPLSRTAAGQGCAGDTCDLGGAIRVQTGRGLPIPLSLGLARTGLVTQQPGGLLAVDGATIMQQTTGLVGTPHTDPRSLVLAPAQFAYDEPPVSIPTFFGGGLPPLVRTDLSLVHPDPASGAVTFSAGGRPGPATVTWCAGAPAPTASFNPGCLAPDDLGSGTPPLVNGLVRYTATRNQFGGVSTTRIGGTARVYFDVLGLVVSDLPCAGGPGCVVAASAVTPVTPAVVGGAFGTIAQRASGTLSPGVFTASIGSSGVILSVGTPYPSTASPWSFEFQGVTGVGFPHTTGRLTISVTGNVGPIDEVFIRTGADGRNADGSGIVSLVSGALSSRTLSGPNAVRGWATLRIPEPRGLLIAASALTMVAIGHSVARRLRRR